MSSTHSSRLKDCGVRRGDFVVRRFIGFTAMRASIPVRSIPAGRFTVPDLANLYLDELFHRAEADQVSWGHYRSTMGRLRRLCEYFGNERTLSAVGKHELLTAVLHFSSRPPCQDQPYQRRPRGEPVSVSTAKQLISQIKALFAWAADHDQLRWERPKGFDRVFKLKAERLKTAQEQFREVSELVCGGVRTYSADTLAQLYRHATSLERLFLLLGLNCGFTSGEIASLRRFEVFLDTDRPYIHKRRHKTGVEARWVLWPETAALLRRHRARANVDLRWLLTAAGKPLVEVTCTHRRDSVDKHWKELFRRTASVAWMGFRFLRKTGANAVKRLGGLEESEMYLAHQEPGLNKHYANRNWERMWGCLEKFRAELPFLGPIWAIEPEECLFTEVLGGRTWGDIEAPFRQRVTKRSTLKALNVSFHTGKQKFYVRVYRKGRTHCGGYFDRVEEAEAAAQALRLELDGIGSAPDLRGVGGLS